MVAELLSIMIKNNGVEGIKIGDKQIIISQFADGTTLFLENERQIPKESGNVFCIFQFLTKLKRLLLKY